MNISVTFCVTCCDKDVHYLDQCIKYIKSQTVKPEEVVVICSGLADTNAIDQLFNKCKKNNYIVYNYSKKRLLPGWARNTGGHISTSDVVCFCDVDDAIHPQKCEYVKKVFKYSKVSALIHNYHTPESFEGWEELNFVYESIERVERIDVGCTNIRTKKDEDVAHGPISCRTNMLINKEITYDETISPGEDGIFCQDIVRHPEHHLYYTPQKLMVYLLN